MYTREDLENDLRKMGIASTDVIVVHSSIKSIGKIDDSEKSGAEVLIDALRNSVSDGILMIPALTYANIREKRVFDIRNTMPCIGALPCVAVELANQAYDNGDKTCIRSMQVSHSVVAFGKDAYDFVACDRETKTRAPMAGCWGKLYKMNGKILLIGTTLNSNTYIHMVDEYFDYDCGRLKPEHSFYIRAIDYDGTEWDQERAVTDGPGSEKFTKRYKIPLEKINAITYGKIGDADAMLVDARKCFDVVMEYRKNYPDWYV